MSVLLHDSFLSLKKTVLQLSVSDTLRKLCEVFPGKVVFSTSFSYEDQVIIDIISRSAPVQIFTLDTGRLFPETYTTWTRTLEQYDISIQAYYPNEAELKQFVTSYGPNAFYQSVELRKNCCAIRKVQPLKSALEGNAVWVTGLRAQHSANRNDLEVLEWDDTNQIIKYNPLLDWTTEQVRNYIDEHNIPYNALHDRGYVSIGCAPCTRAIKPGEDFRAGRWWWEDESKKECGLHVHTIVSK
ncbi:phosphoadenylyl-sulfate reductase [Flavisolibacter ginsengisoli]|jgi:phosphoadenosine phosphosulfate reductase|uniref:Adenosine 5'-phosphosulfate reductase n=1 Tax=Flavisolibacter ginsengisoli DSM 18119 TaxID=1121884 RepID=A0A1M4UQ26_9BACT|nr:phosphoadenylyl-sulfate reductase [Flavisolibacter ginsengisoli]SHE58836.1 phosphoadenosine phosphosulfate reductase [Flavisolibacter ginsengisoli DSM 18119]